MVFDPEEGLLFERDSTFTLLFRFRMQDRASLFHTAGARTQENTSQFQIRRFRLKLEGYTLTPRLEYKFQLGLSERDMNVGDGYSPPNTMLDASVFYKLAPHITIGFGQGKLPVGRQAIVPSGELELPKLPLAHRAFALHRDIGYFLVQNLRPISSTYACTARFPREGRATGSIPGLCNGRLEWLPLGKFTRKATTPKESVS